MTIKLPPSDLVGQKLAFYELTPVGKGIRAYLRKSTGVPIFVRRKDQIERVIKT